MADPNAVCIIGAGISGVATAKAMMEEGFTPIVFEASDAVGGLWQFREEGYGVMAFTHINVTKQNYAFSDYPFPDDVPDFPHHSHMSKYINDYVDHFDLRKHIRFNTRVERLSRTDDNLWEVVTKTDGGDRQVYLFHRVAVSTGHHAKPAQPVFPGQDTFPGKVIHSVKYKDAKGYEDKNVVVVGIGNSAVDAAMNLSGVAKMPVTISSRSGAWVVPNYIFGTPIDHHASRFLLSFPMVIWGGIYELIIKMLMGNPKQWGLNPKAKIYASQPTVSAYLTNHLARDQVVVRPNIERFEGSNVFFSDGSVVEDVDVVLMCTGYRIHLPFLEEKERAQCMEAESNSINLYENVFSPEIGDSLAFIGFVQPTSGGVISMSECQARWWAQLSKGACDLPSKPSMYKQIAKDRKAVAARFTHSKRHTIQRDPLIYNDHITAKFGAKPSFFGHGLMMGLKLLFGSSTAAQWRLQGPGKWEGARKTVMGVPTPALTRVLAWVTFLPLIYLLAKLVSWGRVLGWIRNLLA